MCAPNASMADIYRAASAPIKLAKATAPSAIVRLLAKSATMDTRWKLMGPAPRKYAKITVCIVMGSIV